MGFDKKMVMSVQEQIIAEINRKNKYVPVPSDEVCASFAATEFIGCFSDVDLSRIDRLQTLATSVKYCTSAARDCGERVLKGLDERLVSLHYAALEIEVYIKLFNNSSSNEEKSFLKYLISNSVEHPSAEITEFDAGLEILEYITGAKHLPIPDELLRKAKLLYGIEMTAELEAAIRNNHSNCFYLDFNKANLFYSAAYSPFRFEDFLVDSFNKCFSFFSKDSKTQDDHIGRIRINNVALSECMQGKLEGLTGEEQDRLKKLAVCAAALSDNAKVEVMHITKNGIEKPIPVKCTKSFEIEPESVNRFLKQFQFDNTPTKEPLLKEPISINGKMLRK